MLDTVSERALMVRRCKSRIRLPALLACFALVLSACDGDESAPPLRGAVLNVGPEYSGPGRPLHSWKASESAYVVNFWASWCKPCRIEHDFLIDLAQLGIPVVGVNYADQAEAALEFLFDLGDPYALTFSDPDGAIAGSWNVTAMPVTFLVDDAGMIALRHDGPIGSDFVDRVAANLRDAAQTQR